MSRLDVHRALVLVQHSGFQRIEDGEVVTRAPCKVPRDKHPVQLLPLVLLCAIFVLSTGVALRALWAAIGG